MAPCADHRHTLGAGGFTDSIDAAPVLPRAMSRHKVSRGNQPVQLKRVHAEAARPLLQGGGVQVGEKTGWGPGHPTMIISRVQGNPAWLYSLFG